MKKLLIVDGNSTLNRAFYGIRPLTTKDGLHTNALFGFFQILLRHIESLKPDYMAVTFDLPAPTFRKEAYPLYKANRKPSPDELREQFPYVKECLSAMRICILEKEGYEADDLQGTLARLAHSEPDTTAYILTGDRDLLQLIDEHVRVVLVGSKETACYDTALFTERYGFAPKSLIEAKALMGDASDNIPGVAGIGEKTAYKLIGDFGTLSAVYEHIDEPSIAKGVREKLLKGREDAELSRFLATINTEVPLTVTLRDLAFSGLCGRADELYRVLAKYELINLISRLGLMPDCGEKADDGKKAEELPYREAEADEVLALKGEWVALSICDDGAIAIADGEQRCLFRGPLASILPLFERRLIVFDAKSWYHTLRREGISPRAPLFDVSLAAYVDNPTGSHATPESIAVAYLGEMPSKDVPIAHRLFALHGLLTERLKKTDTLHVLEELELPLAPVLADMEAIGFCVDVEGLRAFDRELEEAVSRTADSITDMAGLAFNIQSPKQLGEVLFERLGIPYPKRRKPGAAYSTDAELLGSLACDYPIVAAVLDYRQLSKFRSTYSQGLLRAADADGKIHSDFKQAVTATGRLSSTEPNLQNIPIRTELGRQFRKYFVTKSHEYVLIDADYSQIELRLLAHMSGDETMIDAYREGVDIHTRTASRAFGIPEEAVTPELRKRAKAVSFGIIYGISAFSLAQDLGISQSDAKRYIESYFAEFPRVAGYLNGVVSQARELGYTETLFGRRRYMPELSASQYFVRQAGERAARNSPLQGTAADIIKAAMIAVHRRLREEGLDAHLILQVHDELILEAHKSDAERAAAILKEEMESAVSLSVPLTAEVTVGSTWLG